MKHLRSIDTEEQEGGKESDDAGRRAHVQSCVDVNVKGVWASSNKSVLGPVLEPPCGRDKTTLNEMNTSCNCATNLVQKQEEECQKDQRATRDEIELVDFQVNLPNFGFLVGDKLVRLLN